MKPFITAQRAFCYYLDSQDFYLIFTAAFPHLSRCNLRCTFEDNAYVVFILLMQFYMRKAHLLLHQSDSHAVVEKTMFE